MNVLTGALIVSVVLICGVVAAVDRVTHWQPLNRSRIGGNHD